MLLLGAGVSLSSLDLCSGLSDSALTELQGTGIGGSRRGRQPEQVLARQRQPFLGGDSKDVKKAMAIGAIADAVVGGVIGNRWGASVVKQKEGFTNTEKWILDNIKQIDTRLGQASALNESLKKQIVPHYYS